MRVDETWGDETGAHVDGGEGEGAERGGQTVVRTDPLDDAGVDDDGAVGEKTAVMLASPEQGDVLEKEALIGEGRFGRHGLRGRVLGQGMKKRVKIGFDVKVRGRLGVGVAVVCRAGGGVVAVGGLGVSPRRGGQAPRHGEGRSE